MKGGAIDETLIKNIADNIPINAELNLSNKNIDNNEAKTLAKALETNTYIRSINLSNNNISDKGILAILKSIKRTQYNKSNVTKLNFINNKLGSVGFFGSKINKILKNIAYNYTLTELKVCEDNKSNSGNKIDETDKIAIDILIRRNNYIKESNPTINASNYKDYINVMHNHFKTIFTKNKGLLTIFNWKNYKIDLNLLEIQKPIIIKK